MKLVRALLALALFAGLLVLAPTTAGAAPAVTSVSPGGAVNTGPAQITINGSGFAAGAKVALVERNPLTDAEEAVVTATSNGTVSADGTTITDVVLPTTGQAPSVSNSTSPSADVSWFVRVTNPDNTSSTSSEFNLLGEQPALTTLIPNTIKQGETKTITLKGANFARRAAIAVNNPSPPLTEPQITLSNATWKALDTYTVQVSVPGDYPTGKRNMALTNTDGKTTTCTGCLEVQAATPVKNPTVNGIDPTSASNGDANDAVSVTITGDLFNAKGNIEAALVGYCADSQPSCPMASRVIPITIDAVTPAGTPFEDDTIEGTVDLVMEAPGRYSVRVSNTGDQPGTGVLANAFELLASPPSISTPTKAAPVGLLGGSTKTFEITGNHFAEGDSVFIADTVITQVVVESRTLLRVTARANTSATSGRRDLTVRHTNGNNAVCDDCIAITSPLPPDDKYIDAVYRLFVERAATTTELNRWRPTVADGGRHQLTTFLATTDEFAGTQIDALYQAILGRPADADGRAYWLQQVRNGTRLDEIAAYFYGSTEYFMSVGSTNTKYVEGLYEDILGRTADAEGRDYWVDLLDRGRLTRSGVAVNFYASIESRRDRVSRQYLLVLGRLPDPQGREYWAGEIGRLGDLVLASFLAASAEYYKRVTGTYP